MRVLFSVAYPLSWAAGGFSVQIRKTKVALEGLGVEVDWVDYGSRDVQRADIVHYWGAPTDLTMWRSGRSHSMRHVVSFLPPGGMSKPRLPDYAKRAVRTALFRSLGAIRLFGRMGIGFETADAFILLNRAEAEYCSFYYKWGQACSYVIPNGVDDAFLVDDVSCEALNALFYPSYICPRKNQLEIARLAKQLKIPVVFAGGDQGEFPEYFARFKAELDGEYAVWLGEVSDRKRLASLYAGARGTFLASDFDNQPLILLESLAVGTPVMATDLPSHRAFFGERIQYCPSAKSRGFSKRLIAFDALCRAGLRQEMVVHGWSDIARQVLDVYKAIMDKPANA